METLQLMSHLCAARCMISKAHICCGVSGSYQEFVYLLASFVRILFFLLPGGIVFLWERARQAPGDCLICLPHVFSDHLFFKFLFNEIYLKKLFFTFLLRLTDDKLLHIFKWKKSGLTQRLQVVAIVKQTLKKKHQVYKLITYFCPFSIK